MPHRGRRNGEEGLSRGRAEQRLPAARHGEEDAIRRGRRVEVAAAECEADVHLVGEARRQREQRLAVVAAPAERRFPLHHEEDCIGAV